MDWYGFPYPALHDFAWIVADELRDFLTEVYTAGQPSASERERQAFWVWAIVLGTLAYDLALSASHSVGKGHIRITTLVNRSLYEYANRLRFYKTHPDKAVLYSQQGWKFYMRMGEVIGSDFVDELPELDPENRIDHQSIGGMLKDYAVKAGIDERVAGRYRRHFHDGFYAAASALAHGSQGAIIDVFRMVKLMPGSQQLSEWMRFRNPNLMPAATFTMVLMLLLILAEVEDFGLLPDRECRSPELMRQFAFFSQPLLDFKEKHAKRVGYEQMALDTLGT